MRDPESITDAVLDDAVRAYRVHERENRGKELGGQRDCMIAALTAANLYEPQYLGVAMKAFRHGYHGIHFSLRRALAAVLAARDDQQTGDLSMATWSRSEKTRKTVSYTVPAPWPQGATWAEVQKALDAARREVHEVTSRQTLSDDALWVKAEDDRIVIYFEMPGKPAP